jgi:hypothetical protein
MGARMRYFVVPEFADRYFPSSGKATPVDAQTAKEHARMMAGRYRTSRRADSTFISLATLAGAVTLTANPDDTITHSILGFPVRYREVKPFLWQEVGGPDKLQAIVVDGKVVSWSTDMLTAAFSFEPQAGLVGAGLALPLVGLALVLILIGFFAWPAGAVARRAVANPRALSRPKVIAIRAGRVFAILAIAATAAWLGLFLAALQNLTPKLDTFLFVSQALAIVAFVGGWIVAAWNLVLDVRGHLGWKRIAWGVAILFAYTMLVWLGVSYGLLRFYSSF